MGPPTLRGSNASKEEVDRLRRLARYQRYAMIALLAFLGSLPGFIGLCYFLDGVMGLPINLYPYQFLGSFLVFQLALYAVMAIINYRLGKEMNESWVLGACIATIFVPAIAIVCLFILSQQATAILQRAGIKVGFLGVNPSSI